MTTVTVGQTSPNLYWIPLVTAAFDLGAPRQAQLLDGGLIQQTWRLQTERGVFIAQKLHPIFDERVTQDGQIIATFLRQQGLPTPTYLLTTTGELHTHLQEDPVTSVLWRVMNCLPGISYPKPPHIGYLEQAGATTAQLHHLLAQLDYQPQFQIPHFHDTPYIWQQLRQQSIPPEIAPEADFLLSSVPSLFIEGIPSQLIHGDLKFSNFLFDAAGRVSGLLDFDTVMRHHLYLELGDALRSWTTQQSQMHLPALVASLKGYQQAASATTTGKDLDQQLIVQGLKLITLELAMRFLQDYFDDYYWAWDPGQYPDRKSHNLARCRQQIALFQDIVRQESSIYQALAQLKY
ncbi:MAG: phosphotransferase [Cyanobacteriota bacterium]|nr:phosphotransferase [Cyanobacteriota bacterium]